MKKIIFFLFFLSFLATLNAKNNPSILFCSPQSAGYGWIDINYLKELHQKGFEVDYTENLGDITWDRIKNYNVIVLFLSPDAYYVCYRREKESKERIENFRNLILKYLENGGGVFLMPTETNLHKQKLIDLTEILGAKIPVEVIVENDKNKIAPMTHMSQFVPAAYTDNIFPSPVSKGIKQIWYPYRKAYLSQMTAPLIVDNNWQVVVRASKTAQTKPVDISGSAIVIKKPVIRKEGEKEPAIFAIREYKGGRVALCAQWRQFTIGAGTKWLYNREILSKGLKEKKSDFGKLLENTFRYLARPSLENKKVGGYITKKYALIPPNQREGVKKRFNERFWKYEPEVLGYGRPPKNASLYRGIIGVKTSYSSGKGSVKEYAEAGKKAGLDFIVFADDFKYLTEKKFEKLKEDCKKYSDDKIKLFPGFSIRSNIGNYLLFFGPSSILPPSVCLTGKDKKTLYVQEEDGKGGYTGRGTGFLSWVLTNFARGKCNVCYYNFKGSGKGMKMPDLRLYSAAGIRYYRNGKLIEDVTDDYLITAAGTIAPNPVSVNEVYTPSELIEEVNSNHSLTWVQARSLNTLFKDGLRWTHQYDGVNIFLSNGPEIIKWPACHRVITLGAENFVTGISVMPSPVYVKSNAGLKEIRIYNGDELYRRFILNGEKEFHQTLVLDGTVQKDLVLVAEDINGGKAVSFPRRCWKGGGRAVVFCGDHVNDCKSGGMLMGRGPNRVPFTWVPPLPVDIAGYTWDGGPPSNLPLVTFEETRPVLKSDKGVESGVRFSQIPILEFSDEGAVAVTSEQKNVFEKSVEQVLNPWHTFGPIDGPSKLMEFTQRYREYEIPTVGVPETGWAGPGVRKGINACLFINEIKFKKDINVKSLQIATNWYKPFIKKVIYLTGSFDGKREKIKVNEVRKNINFKFKKGDWFAVYSPDVSATHIFINRGEPLLIRLNWRTTNWIKFYADLKEVKKGDEKVYEVFSLGVPVDMDIKNDEDILDILKYLKNPEGLKIIRGSRIKSYGIIELKGENYAVEFSVPENKEKLNIALPFMIKHLNKRWSAVLWQKNGYVKGDYGNGKNRFRELGIDVYGNAYIPVYSGLSDTHIVAGQPVIAEGKGADKLFIQVTHAQRNPDKWHISVNNPENKEIRVKLKKVIDLPGMKFKEKDLILKPGEYIVIE